MDVLDVLAGMIGRDPTRNEIADALGVHASTISRRMSGTEGFRLEEVIQLCAFFKLSVTETLVELDVLEAGDVGKAARIYVRPISELTELEILGELTIRASAREDPSGGRKRSRGRGLFN